MGVGGGPGGAAEYAVIAGGGSSWVPVRVAVQTAQQVVMVLLHTDKGLHALDVIHCLPAA